MRRDREQQEHDQCEHAERPKPPAIVAAEAHLKFCPAAEAGIVLGTLFARIAGIGIFQEGGVLQYSLKPGQADCRVRETDAGLDFLQVTVDLIELTVAGKRR